MAKKSSTAKIKILDAAQKLMLNKGFIATSIDEICATAGLTKGSFFHYFKNKEHLGKTVLTHYNLNVEELMNKHGFPTIDDPLERIFGFMEFIIAIVKNKTFDASCLIGNFAQELSYTHEQIRIACAESITTQSDMVKKYFDEAKNFYDPKESIDSHQLANSLLALIQGSLLLAKAEQDITLIEENLNYFKSYLKNIFNKK